MAIDTSNIKMSPEEMESAAGNFEKSRADFDTVVNQMKQMVNNLCSQWAGQSSQAFETQFTDLQPSFQKTDELITDIATQLRNVSSTMTQMDQDIASKIGVSK
jgi:WXG100 family type VII secretion target